METADQSQTTPDRKSVEAQVQRVLSSSYFISSTRMRHFLEFVVQTKLNEDLGSLKESLIGVAVFGRPANYDTQNDSIVRVEARRLRGKLRSYYEAEGKADPIEILLPVGAYVPEFVEKPFPLETTISPAEEKAPPEKPENAEPIKPVSFGRRYAAWAVALAGLAVLAAGVAAWWRNTDGPKKATTVPLTSYSGAEFAPQISPDGKQIAFVWDGNKHEYNIYTKLLEIGNPVRVTSGEGHDLNPNWSPDGKYLAFVKVGRREKTLTIVPALGGSEKKLANLTPSEIYTWRADASQMYGSPGPAWSPNGDIIAVTDYPSEKFGGALLLVGLDGKRRLLTHPDSGTHDFSPAFSPDGASLAFIRYTSAYTSDLYVASLKTGEVHQVTQDRQDIQGISWLPDNRTIVFSSNRSRSYSLWTVEADGSAPVPVAVNGTRLTEPSVSRDGQFLAFTDTVRISNIWKARRNTVGAYQAPSVAISSSRQSYCAHFSPDGKRIVFISDRSGSFEVWVSKADGSEPTQITNFGGPMVGSPRWSPNGEWITFDARVDGRAAIFIVNAAGGAPRRLEQNGFEERMPSWSQDGKWLYFCSNRGGRVQLWKSPVGGGPALRVSTRIAFTSFESSDGQTLYFTSLGGGLWQVPTSGGEESAIPALNAFHSGLYVAVAKSGIYLVDQETSRNILHYSFASQRVVSLFQIPRTMVIDSSSLDVSPDESEIIFSQVDASGSDVMLARHWR